MPGETTIQLGEHTFQVSALPLGKLRRLLPAFTRAGRAFAVGSVGDDALDDVFDILATATGVPASEIEEVPGTYLQLMQAVDIVADVCGLKPKEDGDKPGEALPGTSPASTPGTPSTPG